MRLLLLILMTFLCACEKAEEKTTPTAKTTIAVTNYPLKWIAETLLEDASLVNYPVIPDIDPAFWEPTKEDLQLLVQNKKILTNGATYEKWLETAELPQSKLIDTSVALKDDYVIIKNAVTHEHDGDTHSHDGTAFTTWLQEEFMLAQIKSVSQELQKVFPDKKDSIVAKEKQLIAQISELHKNLKAVFAERKKYLASHPIYQYLAQDNELEILSFLWEPDAMPAPEQWKEFIDKKGHSQYMLWEDEPLQEVAEKLHRAGIKVIVFRQCGNIPASGDYIKEMQQNINNVSKALNQ